MNINKKITFLLLLLSFTLQANDKYCSTSGKYYCALVVNDPATNTEYCVRGLGEDSLATDGPKVIIPGINVSSGEFIGSGFVPGDWYPFYSSLPGKSRIQGVTMRHSFAKDWTNPVYHPPVIIQNASYVYEFDCLPCTSPYTFDPQSKGCVKYCPPSKPSLNLETGQCEGKGPKQCELTQGNPVVVSSGEKVEITSPDYLGSQLFPLQFNWNYRSHRAPEASPQFSAQFNQITTLSLSNWVKYMQPAGFAGIASQYKHLLTNPWSESVLEDGTSLYTPPISGHKQWRHNYQYRMYFTGSKVTLQRPTGSDIYFTQEGVNYLSSQATGKRITPVMSASEQKGWQFEPNRGLREIYDLSGKLIQLQQTASVYQTLEYNEASQLISITHSLGGYISLTYNQLGQLIQLTPATDKMQVSYSYDSTGNLTTIEQQIESTPGTFTTIETRHYHYEDSHYPYALTGITDERGVRYVNWEYDNMGRVIENYKPNNQERFSFSYNGEISTSVTNPLGKKTTYNFSTGSGDKRFTRIEGDASNNCMAANKTYSYYTRGTSKGLIHKQTDWNGVTTIFSYNARGLETTRYEALYTPEQKLINTEWHPTEPWPIKVIADREIVEYQYDGNGNIKAEIRTVK